MILRIDSTTMSEMQTSKLPLLRYIAKSFGRCSTHYSLRLKCATGIELRFHATHHITLHNFLLTTHYSLHTTLLIKTTTHTTHAHQSYSPHQSNSPFVLTTRSHHTIHHSTHHCC